MVKLPYPSKVVLPFTAFADETILSLQHESQEGKAQFNILAVLFFYNVPIEKSHLVPDNEMHFYWGEFISVFETTRHRPTGDLGLGAMPESPSLHQ